MKIIASSNKTGESLLHGALCWTGCLLEEAESPETLRGNIEDKMLSVTRTTPIPLITRTTLARKAKTTTSSDMSADLY